MHFAFFEWLDIFWHYSSVSRGSKALQKFCQENFKFFSQVPQAEKEISKFPYSVNEYHFHRLKLLWTILAFTLRRFALGSVECCGNLHICWLWNPQDSSSLMIFTLLVFYNISHGCKKNVEAWSKEKAWTALMQREMSAQREHGKLHKSCFYLKCW